jgi:hypothetical protein
VSTFFVDDGIVTRQPIVDRHLLHPGPVGGASSSSRLRAGSSVSMGSAVDGRQRAPALTRAGPQMARLAHHPSSYWARVGGGGPGGMRVLVVNLLPARHLVEAPFGC